MKRSRLGVGARSRERGSTFKAPRKGLKRTAGRASVVTPLSTWLAVLIRDDEQCAWCRREGHRGRAEHPHHLLPKQTWPELVGAVANIVALCGDCHMRHEFSPRDRLPWDALPGSCQEFLTAVAAVDPRAARLVAVKYPRVNEKRSSDVRNAD
jgi:hypothetical protein